MERDYTHKDVRLRGSRGKLRKWENAIAMKGEENRDGTQDEAKNTLRIKTGCAELFDILLFKNKINVILGLEIAPKVTKKSQFQHLWSSQFYTLYVIGLIQTK